MTADMVQQFHSESEFVKTPDGNFIQVFFLPAAKRFENVQILACNSIIICNPNFGFAETQQYCSEWPNFYLDFGINVILWNYRGYGNSTGVPSPENNRADAELVCAWAR